MVEVFGINLKLEDSILKEVHPGSEEVGFDLCLTGTTIKYGSLGISLGLQEEHGWDSWLNSIGTLSALCFLVGVL